MSKVAILLLIAAVFISIQALDCPTGSYGPASGATKYQVCYYSYQTFDYNPETFNMNGTVKPKFVGWEVSASLGIPLSYCPYLIDSVLF